LCQSRLHSTSYENTKVYTHYFRWRPLKPLIPALTRGQPPTAHLGSWPGPARPGPARPGPPWVSAFDPAQLRFYSARPAPLAPLHSEVPSDAARQPAPARPGADSGHPSPRPVRSRSPAGACLRPRAPSESMSAACIIAPRARQYRRCEPKVRVTTPSNGTSPSTATRRSAAEAAGLASRAGSGACSESLPRTEKIDHRDSD
jgi:hypothetical protein